MNMNSTRSIQADATVRNMLANLGLDEYLNREGITELLINRPYELFLETPNGTERIEDSRLTIKALEQLASALAIYNSKHLCFEEPIHSVTLPDGERGHVLMPPACEDKTLVIAVRKPSKSRFGLSDYSQSGRISGFKDVGNPEYRRTAVIDSETNNIPENTPHTPLADWQRHMLAAKANRDAETFFRLAVEHKCNICMVGGTGSGKTTFTKALADLIPANTRLITLEDTHELDLPKHPNHVHLFYRQHITAKMLIAACMRLKPDRVLLTELRGDEAWDYLSLLNTGHAGGLTSVHANDAESALYRIAQLAKESATGQTMAYDYILNTVRATIDVIAFFEKTHLKELYYDPAAKYRAMAGRD